MLPPEFPCFGIKALGMCYYNPGQPPNVYFSLGEAITALGFLLAIQQFLKPIFVFRMRSYGIRLEYLYGVFLLGFLCILIAAALPNFSISIDAFYEYPILWEILGSIFMGVAYFIIAFISLMPARVYNCTLLSTTRAAGALLSEAEDADRVNFAKDLARNLPKLIDYAGTWDRADRNATAMEFERLRQIGAPLSIQGRVPLCPFYAFAHRRELENASHATTFLRFIADSHFCSALVRKSPWRIAYIINNLSEQRLYVRSAESFVQEVAYQAITNDESMMAREVGYEGFGAVPLLSDSLFGDWFILQHYNPLEKLWMGGTKKPSEGYVSRLNGASKMILETAISNGDYYPQRYMHTVERTYEDLFRQLSYASKSSDVSIVGIHGGISALYKLLFKALETLESKIRKPLFIKNPEEYRRDLVDVVASIVYKSLESFANSFQGGDDDNWIHAITTFMDIYPLHASDIPAGMDPLQQQLALQFIKKLRQNMDGWYPAISRVLLAVIGPYESAQKHTTRTAYLILKDAVYKELQKLPKLHAEKPDKISDFLPPNVIYDAAANTLIHKYRSGEPSVTNLSTLNIPDIDLTDEKNWRV